jgi:PEP-CTERM motif
MKVKLAVALAILCCASIVRADGSSGITSYDINGSMTLTGNSSCPSCTQTIDFSFTLDFGVPEAGNGIPCFADDEPTCIAGPVSVSSTGPLGSFSGYGNLDPDHGWYTGFINHAGDEVDLYMNLGDFSGATAPSAMPSNLFSCQSSACVADFSTVGGGFSEFEYQFNVAAQFTATDPSRAVPEPSSLLLSVIGLASLVFARSKSNRSSSTPL